MPKLVSDWPEAAIETESRIGAFRQQLQQAVEIAKKNPGKPVLVNDDEYVSKSTYANIGDRFSAIYEMRDDFEVRWALMDRKTPTLPSGKKSYKYYGQITIAYKPQKSGKASEK